MTKPERLTKLFALLTIGVVWAVLMGEIQCETEPLKVKKHGRLEKSVFRHGFDVLRRIFLHPTTMKDEFQQALRLLLYPSTTSNGIDSRLLSCT